MADILKPDLCVIGAGAAGLSVAERASRFGASVVLVERAEMGGMRLNTACLPSSTLAASARLADRMRRAGRFGLTPVDPRPSFKAIAESIEATTEDIAPVFSVEHVRALGAQVLEGEARFVGRRTVSVGDQLVRARRFVIATGSRSVIPDIPGLADIAYFTTDTIFANARKLTHLVIIGGGPSGLEIAQAYARLGSQVTVIEQDRALSTFDRGFVDIVLRHLRADGVDVRELTHVSEIQPRSQGIGIVITSAEGTASSLDVSHVLVAAGRRPALDGLDLDKAGIGHDGRDGRLRIGPGLRTSNRRIYILGDAAGAQFNSHGADYQARSVVLSALFGLPLRSRPERVPRCVFTSPEIAEVGLTVAELERSHRRNWRIVRVGFDASDRLLVEREPLTSAHMIVDGAGRVLGAGIAGGQAREIITLFSLAVARRLNVADLADLVVAYPSESAIVSQLVAQYLREAPPRPWMQRWRQLVRRLP